LTACWEKNYKPKDLSVPEETLSPGKSKNAWVRHLQGTAQIARRKDELQIYLSEKTSINADKSALDWWKVNT